jgi:hypothetical protein
MGEFHYCVVDKWHEIGQLVFQSLVNRMKMVPLTSDSDGFTYDLHEYKN